jgi:predicted ATPase
MIKYLKIEGLNGNNNPLEFNFNDDLNLFTGLNGCGKTTLLKVLWFVNSGKVFDLVNEIVFRKIEVISSSYEVDVEKKDDTIHVVCKKNKKKAFEFTDNVQPKNSTFKRVGFDYTDLFYPMSEESIFFPTFRRIEGGFSMENKGARYRRVSYPLKEALSDLSEELSSDKHLFIASVSTDDISDLLDKEYSSIVRSINNLQKEKFELIQKRIKRKKGKNAEEILKEIESDITEVETSSEEKIRPFTVLENMVISIFHKKGIEMNTITFGDWENAISSDKLSAGEKQMLSFLCYNTFSKNKIIFIDEPELSLHQDWQRLLIPTLLRQNNNNQFFIATHSPFIYASYPDKEIILNKDKGE